MARCIGDFAATNVGGFVTFVISDPGNEPGPSVLSQWGATWLSWGALDTGDCMYNAAGTCLTSAAGVFYYNQLFYRQLVADPGFAQSIASVGRLAPPLQQNAMGEYWPTIGYCTLAAFTAQGAGCVP